MSRNRIIYYVTRQYMKQNKRRTCSTIAGISLMILLMTCVFVGKDTTLRYLEKAAAADKGNWHVCMYDLTDAQCQKVRQLGYVKKMVLSQSYGCSDFLQSGKKERPYLNIKAYTKQGMEWQNIQLKNGRFPNKNNEIVLSDAVRKDGGNIQIGDAIAVQCFTRKMIGTDKKVGCTIFPFQGVKVSYGKETMLSDDFPYYEKNTSFKEVHEKNKFQGKYTVVGFVSTPWYEKESAAGYTAFVKDRKSAVVSKYNVMLQLDTNRQRDYITDLQNIAGKKGKVEVNNMLLSFSANSSDSTMNDVINFMEKFFIFFIGIVSILLIYNMFQMSYSKRCYYLGMLSSVGATSKQRKASVFYEAAILWLISCPIGIGLGILVVQGGMALLSPLFDQILALESSSKKISIAVSLAVSVKNLLTVLGVSLLTVFVSAILPARKVAKIPPMESIRGNEKFAKKNYGTKYRWLQKKSGVSYLAKCNSGRRKKMSRGLVRSLAIFLIVIMTVSFSANAVIQIVSGRVNSYAESDYTFQDEKKYDYLVMVNKEKDPKEFSYQTVKQEIEQDTGVEKCQEMYVGNYVANIKNEDMGKEYWESLRNIIKQYYSEKSAEKQYDKIRKQNDLSVNIVGVERSLYEKIRKSCNPSETAIAGSGKDGIIIVQLGMLSTNNYRFENRQAKKYQMFEITHMTDKKVGEQLRLQLQSFSESKASKDSAYALNIDGLAQKKDLKPYLNIPESESLNVIVTKDTAKSMQKKAGEQSFDRKLFVTLNGKNTGIKKQLNELVSKKDDGSVFVIENMERTMKVFKEALCEIIQILAWCFVILVSLICLINFYNSIRNYAMLRGKEMAMLYSMGMTKKQRNQLLFRENNSLLLRSVLSGTLISICFIVIVQKILSSYMGHMEFTCPWQVFVFVIIIVSVLFHVFSIKCYNGLNYDTIVEQLKREE